MAVANVAAVTRYGIGGNTLMPENNPFTSARLYMQQSARIFGYFADGATKFGTRDFVVFEGDRLSMKRILSPLAGMEFNRQMEGLQDAAVLMQAERILSYHAQSKQAKNVLDEIKALKKDLGKLNKITRFEDKGAKEAHDELVANRRSELNRKEDEMAEYDAAAVLLANSKEGEYRISALGAGLIGERQEAENVIADLEAKGGEVYIKKVKGDVETLEGEIKNTTEKIAAFEENPEYYKRLKEVARYYRAFMATALEYMVDGGKMERSHYDRLMKNQDHYVEMRRLRAAAPDQILEWAEGSKREALGTLFQDSFTKTIPGLIGKTVSRGALGNAISTLQPFKGSTNIAIDPFLTMFETVDRMISETDRNHIVDQHLEMVDPRKALGGEQRQILRSMAVPSLDSKGNWTPDAPYTLPRWNKGKLEYWKLNKDFYGNLRGLSGAPVKAWWPMTIFAKTVRYTVTHFPLFALRQRHFRDAQERQLVSRTADRGVKNVFGFADIVKTIKPVTKEDVATLRRFSADQSHHYLSGPVNWYSYIRGLLRRQSTDSNVVFRVGSFISDSVFDYGEWIANSDRSNRLLEFNSAVKHYRDLGWDEANAHQQAALEALDLMHFAMAGDWLQYVRQIIPFAAVPFQSIRRQALAWQEDKWGTLARTVQWGFGPGLALRAMIHGLGLDDEYEEFNARLRDTGWLIPIPWADKDVTWLWFPKSYEWGLFASAADRSFSKFVLNRENAFDGFGGSALKIVTPFETHAAFAPMLPLVEWYSEKQLWTGRYVIPPHEQGQPLNYDKRPRMREASKLAQAISMGANIPQLFGIGDKNVPFVDGRKVDNAMSSFVGGWWRVAAQASNIGSTDGDHFSLLSTGFVRSRPGLNAQTIQTLYKIREHDGRLEQHIGKWEKFRQLQKKVVNARKDDLPKAEQRVLEVEMLEVARDTLADYREKFGDVPLDPVLFQDEEEETQQIFE